jgi:hypothetical protein
MIGDLPLVLQVPATLRSPFGSSSEHVAAITVGASLDLLDPLLSPVHWPGPASDPSPAYCTAREEVEGGGPHYLPPNWSPGLCQRATLVAVRQRGMGWSGGGG